MDPLDVRPLGSGPDSIVWQRSGDVRLMLASSYALLLQLGHPTVAAGVLQHSDYRTDPWRRMQRSSDYATVMIYGGATLAAEEGRRLREMHKAIKGVAADGRRYHALEPRAFAWVHATLGEAILRANERFVGRLLDDEEERFYGEFRRLGRLHGVRDVDLPDTLRGFRAYFDEMIEHELEDSAAVQDFLAFAPTSSPLPSLPASVWKRASGPLIRVAKLAGHGMLPPTLRARFGIAWGDREERSFRRLTRTVRALTPLLPATLRNTGPYYMRIRDRVMARAARRS